MRFLRRIGPIGPMGRLGLARAAALLAAATATSCVRPSLDASWKEDVVIWRDPARYAPFPQLWVGPADELWVAFGTGVERSHSAPRPVHVSMHSTDGGRTWTPGGKPPHVGAWRMKDGSLLTAGVPWSKHHVVVRRSTDGGKTWRTFQRDMSGHAAHGFHGLHGGTKLRDDTILLPYYGRADKTHKADTAWILRSTDAGHSWTCTAVARDPKDGVWYNEMSLLEVAPGRVIGLMRVEKTADYLHQIVSADGGATWSSPKRTPIMGHPPNLIRLASGKVLCTYGYRHYPFGIRAVLSHDGGRTWDMANEKVLRADGAHHDLGYPLSAQLADGTIVSVYYFTKGDNATHIAATRYSEDFLGSLSPEIIRADDNVGFAGNGALAVAQRSADPARHPASHAIDGGLRPSNAWLAKGLPNHLDITFSRTEAIDRIQVFGEPGGRLADTPLQFQYFADDRWLPLSGKLSGRRSRVALDFPLVATKKVRVLLGPDRKPEPDVVVPIREVAVWRKDDREGIDQANETGNAGWHSLYGQAPHWHTFIPTKDTIVKAALRLQNVSDSFRPHEAGITASVQAERGGSDLAAASLPADELAGGWNFFRFPKPVNVVPGRTYWLQFRCAAPVSAKHRYVFTTGGDYARGGLDMGQGVTKHKIGFRTYFKE